LWQIEDWKHLSFPVPADEAPPVDEGQKGKEEDSKTEQEKEEGQENE